MIAANIIVDCIDGFKKTQNLVKKDKLDCVEISINKHAYYAIKDPTHNRGKIYNVHFVTGNLYCTFDQHVLCKGKKSISIGEAMINDIPIYTVSGLVLPHAIQNMSQAGNVFDIQLYRNQKCSYVICGVYCM
jgi:hypothetical protein